MINYGISLYLGSAFLVTRLSINNSIKNNTVSGDTQTNSFYHCNISETWYETLAAGTHTIKVQYRTTSSISYDPNADWQQAFLQLTLFGNQ